MERWAGKEQNMKKKIAGSPAVLVLMGSDSDWPVMQESVRVLKDYNVACDVAVLSAHRTPERAAALASGAIASGVKVIIAAAGSSAHLAGVLAAHTTLPVIGVPMKGGALDGLDALLSTVQMPAGIPVATVALGKAGAVNAALLAIQVLALNDARLRSRLVAHKQELKRKVDEANGRLRADLERMK